MSDDFDSALDRSLEREDKTTARYGFAFSKQGEAFVRKYYLPVADKIGADRVVPKDRNVWRLLRPLMSNDETLATQLLCAAVTVCHSRRLGADKDGILNYRDQAIWLGWYFGVRERDDAFLVGNWGIAMLPPPFHFDGEVLSLRLTDNLDHFLTGVIANDTRKNGIVWPTEESPEPWTQVRDGGLPEGHWAVRSLTDRRKIEDVWRKAIGTGQMQSALDALNHLQSPAFTINKPVLKFMKWLGFSRSSPVRADFKTDDECKWALEEWRNLLQSWRFDIAVADYLATVDHFYIALALEFRGRTSPIPYFHYQRGDDIRGLFLFRDGEPMSAGDRSYEWLLCYAAARADGVQWGGTEKPSKLRLKRRFDWARDNLKTIRRIGAGVLSGAFDQVLPLIDSIEDRCQFIAICVEIENLHRALESGSDFITHFPILMDMSNSALQHWGTLVRAPETEYANLNGNVEPDDYYTRITADVHATGHEATCLMKGGTDRGIVKGAVVAHSYGSRPGRIEYKRIVRDSNVVFIPSPTGMTKGIVDALKDRGPLPDNVDRLAPKLASLILRADNQRTPYVQGAKKFINAIARLYSKHNLDFRWTTKLGLPVINFYRKPLTKRVRYYDFKTEKWCKKKLAIGYSDEIDALEANRAAGANFIHSMDGVGGHLGMIALETAKEKMQLIIIHDCFGCLATRAGRLHVIVRETLARLHEDDETLLSDILERAKHDLPKNVKLPALPKTGNQDLSKIRISHNLCK